MYLNNDLSVDDYISIIKRKYFFIAGLASTLFIIAFFVILFLPSVYESSAQILIESEEVEASKDNPYGQKDGVAARFEALNARLLTNERMLKIAKDYDLFDANSSKVLTPQDEVMIANLVRKQIKTNMIQAEVGNPYQQKPILAVKVSSRFDTPETTYSITKDIVDTIVSENKKRTTDKVTSVASFFDKEAKDKKAALERIEQELIAYKKSHAGMLPENRTLHVEGLERLRDDLSASQKEQAIARSELSSLNVELASARAGISSNPMMNQVGQNAYSDELDDLRAQLSQAKTIYSDSHPAVKAIKSKMNALKQLEATVKTPQVDTMQSIEVARVEAQIDAAKGRVRAIEREENQIRARIKKTESLLFQSGQTEGVLESLERKYDAAKDAYQAAKNKQDQARVEKDIELQDKGERFVVNEPPVMPTYPVQPKRKLLLAGSLLLALGLGVIIAVLMEFFDRRLRGQAAIASTLKMQPMAVIPYIKNKSDANKARYKMMNLVYLNLTVITLCLLVIHFFVSPFDEVMAKIMSKV